MIFLLRKGAHAKEANEFRCKNYLDDAGTSSYNVVMAMLNGDMIPGYDGGHHNTVFSSGRDFSTPRIINSAGQIPLIGPWGMTKIPVPIRLRGIGRYDKAAMEFVAAHGAHQMGSGWVVDRRDPFPFDQLKEFLPRMARRSIRVDLVDLVPRTEWYTSLANMMVDEAWGKLAGRAWSKQFVCYECGSLPFKDKQLDCHEVWWYNAHEVAGRDRQGSLILGVRRLRALRMLCALCHETQHLGNADKRGHYARAFERLGAINRINWGPLPAGEAGAYRDEIYKKYSSRNRVRVAWNLDLAAAAGIRLQLKKAFRHAGDGVIIKKDSNGDDRTIVRIVNADIGTYGAHVWVEPKLATPQFVNI